MYDTNNTPRVIYAPEEDFEPREHHLFIAGGITNCPDWQSELIQKIGSYPTLNVFNPRRPEYPMDKPEAAFEQIAWERKYLKAASAIAVWFSNGSINPIVLYELGRWVNGRPEIPAFIGIEPGYEREQDVRIQTGLDRPELEIVDDLDAMIGQITAYLDR